MGSLLRDYARDRPAAIAAFANAARLDPLGDGVGALVAMHERAGAMPARREVLDSAIAELRGQLDANPLDVRRLGRLHELCGMELAAPLAGHATIVGIGPPDDMEGPRETAAVAGQILSLLGEEPDERSAAPRGELRAP